MEKKELTVGDALEILEKIDVWFILYLIVLVGFFSTKILLQTLWEKIKFK